MRAEVPQRCFEGMVPSSVASCSPGGVPNVIHVSYVSRVDERHVALSRQFFNKTFQNLAQNPQVTLLVVDPLNGDHYRLEVRWLRSETQGPLFEAMSHRIDAIGSQTGTADIFKLQAAEVLEVLGVDHLPALSTATVGSATTSKPHELRALQALSERINRAKDLEELLASVLEGLEEQLGFRHSMILFVDESHQRLYTVASRGYADHGVGSEVLIGEGLIGTVARNRRLLRVACLGREMHYARAVRRESGQAADEVALPGLPNAQSQLILPILLRDDLLGVLATETTEQLRFGEMDETFLNVVANQLAVGIRSMVRRNDDEAPSRPASAATPSKSPATRRFRFYRADDCVFVDGEYLIRNVPGRILWKLLKSYRAGQCEFSNRELRLDASLGLPDLRDNLESRLILLRKRLELKCPELRMVRTARGRFALEVACGLELEERDAP